jgi:hypothetical protein
MVLVLLPLTTAYYMNDSNYKVLTIFSNGGVMQNKSVINATHSIGQTMIGNVSSGNFRARIGIWFTWNTTNVTVGVANLTVEIIHPNATEEELRKYMYNVSWNITNEVGSTNTTIYLVFADGTQHKIFKNISVENQLWDIRDTSQGYYTINVTVEDTSSIASASGFL